MVIHVVQPEETIHSIADEYGISVERLIQENDLSNQDNLVVGQAILIVYPKELYTVQEGDSLQSIAESHDITVLQLLRNNPFLVGREVIYPGETLVISYSDDKSASISVNGYVYPYIEKGILEKNLLYLTYLSIYHYTILENGELSNIDDTELIALAKAYGVAPIMVLSYLTEEVSIDNERLYNLLINRDMQDELIDNILSVLKAKGYYGMDFDSPYISAENWPLYLELVSKVTERLNREGFKVFATLTPNSFQINEGTYTEISDNLRLGQITDGVILLAYAWGQASGIPIEVIPTALFEALLEYALTQIPPEKLTFGISSIGYIWHLPYVEGVSRANSISNTNAIQLASDAGAQINYSQYNLASYFYIFDDDNYLVYFHDIRSVDASIQTVVRHGLKGVGIWNIMYFQAQTFLLINSQYMINTVLNT